MGNTKSNSTLQNIFTVIAGAFLLGFLWRVRGETGWGSSWGLLNAGFVFTMFLVVAKGAYKKMNLAWIGITAISFMLTVPSWGTLLHQVSGILYREEFWQKGMPYVEITQMSGIVLMLALGFGLATLFGIFLGRGYSDKQWKIWDVLIILAVFYAFDYASKATVSHWILNALQPQATEIFADGLKKANIQGDVYHVYLQHFDNLAWAKKFDGGRNYFSSIQAISSVIRSIAAIIATRFIVKDKVAAKSGLLTSCAFAVAITVADVFFYLGNGGYHMEQESLLPKWVSVWSSWEFFTGFIAGAIITAFVLALKKKEDTPELVFSWVPDKAKTVLTFILGYVFLLGVNFVRPVLERTKHFSSATQIIATVIAAVVAVVAVVFVVRKCGMTAEKVDFTNFAKYTVITFTTYITLLYMFLGEKDNLNCLTLNLLPNFLMPVSLVIVVVWCLSKKKKSSN